MENAAALKLSSNIRLKWYYIIELDCFFLPEHVNNQMIKIKKLLPLSFLYAVLMITGCIDDPPKPQRIAFSPDKDTLIGPDDTLLLCVDYPDQRSLRYYWKIDDVQCEITDSNVFYATWAVCDTGRHNIVLGVLDADNFIPDTISITVRGSNPQVKMSGPLKVIVNDTAVFHAKGIDRDGSVKSYLWSVDKKGNFWYSDTSDSFKIAWRLFESGLNIIRVKGIDDDGLVSNTDSLIVNVVKLHPAVKLLSADTAVFSHDTLLLKCTASDSDGQVIRYKWSIDGNAFPGISDSLYLSWGVESAGKHIVTAVSIDDDSLQSVPDTVVIEVIPGYPLIGPLPDASIYINDVLKLKTSAFDSNGIVTGYLWTVDGKNTAGGDSLLVSWNRHSYGRHTVIVRAVDNDSLKSDPDTVLIDVKAGFPVIVPVRDTVLSTKDTMVVTCFASDTNGKIVSYMWDLDGNGFGDVSSLPQKTIRFTGKNNMSVKIEVLDDDSLLCIDTFTVIFNNQPEIKVIKPHDRDTLWLGEKQFPGVCKFEAEVSDPDSDSVSFSLYLSENGGPFQQLYSGKNDLINITVNSPGEYHWKVAVQDDFGNKKEKEGVLTVIRQHQICFAGHSIIVGNCGDDNTGGFRAGVLKGLRDSLGPFESLKAVGPITTTYMINASVDDSCLAFSGTTARDMSYILKSYPELKADIWVLMMGANSEYKSPELNFTISMIDTMYNRNQKSRIYVLNSPPFPNIPRWEPANTTYLPAFNEDLYDAISTRKGNGYLITMVDAFTLLSNEGEFDSTLFCDHVHPNQTGYDLLTEEILKKMFSSDLPSMDLKP